MKEVLPLDTFEACLLGSIFAKTTFCLGGKQGVLVKDECSSWYNIVGDSFIISLGRRKEILYSSASVCMAQQNNPTPECVVNSTECYDG